MLTKRIIPCLDVKDGRVVKGVNFANFRDAGDPVELGAKYSSEGADELVFLDITATIRNNKTIVEMVRNVAEHVSIPFTVGGGVRSADDVGVLLQSGAKKVSISTASVLNPDVLKESADRFGNQCIVQAIDTKRNKEDPSKNLVYLKGGTEATDLDTIEWAQRAEELGVCEILLTSMDADGTKNGFDCEITRKVAEAVSIPVIASGGAGSLQSFADAVLIGKADAVLAASVFHYGEITIRQTKEYMASKGISVRL